MGLSEQAGAIEIALNPWLDAAASSQPSAADIAAVADLLPPLALELTKALAALSQIPQQQSALAPITAPEAPLDRSALALALQDLLLRLQDGDIRATTACAHIRYNFGAALQPHQSECLVALEIALDFINFEQAMAQCTALRATLH